MLSVMLLLGVVPSTQGTVIVWWRFLSLLTINTRNDFSGERDNLLVIASVRHVLSLGLGRLLVLMLGQSSSLVMLAMLLMMFLLMLIETSGVVVHEVMNLFIHVLVANELRILFMFALGHRRWSIIQSLPLWIWWHVLVGEFVYPWVVVLWRNWVDLFVSLGEAWRL